MAFRSMLDGQADISSGKTSSVEMPAVGTLYCSIVLRGRRHKGSGDSSSEDHHLPSSLLSPPDVASFSAIVLANLSLSSSFPASIPTRAVKPSATPL